MRLRLFTFLMMFLAIAGNAVWGQESTTIEVSKSEDSGSMEGNYYFDYDNENNYRKLTIYQSGNYTIKGDPNKNGDGDNNTNVQIVIATAGTYYITLDNVRSDANLGNDLDGSDTSGEAKYPDRCAFQIGDDSNTEVIVNLKWNGHNKFWSGRERAGINVKPGATLILNGLDGDKNSLEAGSFNNSAMNFTYGAGIGGDSENPNFGTIIINSGKISAYSQDKANENRKAMGAGIGGGYHDADNEVITSTQGTIYINGGIVTAECQDVQGDEFEYGSGIGGGYKGTCTRIVIIGKETTSVTASSAMGADIGVGNDVSYIKKPEIIIGKWDKDVSVTVNAENITETNFVNGLNVNSEGYTYSGTVTMPEGYQMYVDNELTTSSNGVFNAYNVTLQNTEAIEDESGDHAITGAENLEERSHYYYGKKASFEQDVLSCNKGHLFMGWTSENDTKPAGSDNTNIKFQMPDQNATGLTKYVYTAAWVDNFYSIVVASGTTWEANGSNTPRIYTAGVEENNLTFSFANNETKTEYTSTTTGLFTGKNKLSFSENQLIGTPTLPEGEQYLQEEITAYVKLGESEVWKALTIQITCVEEVVITSANITASNHIYDGKPHNGLEQYRGDDITHLLTVEMDANYDGAEDPGTLKEGVHYRIASFKKDNGASTVAEDPNSALITDAGEYSEITIEALDGTTISSSLDKNHKSYTISETVTVAQRPLTISFSLAETSLEEGEEPTADMVTVVNEKYDATNKRGLVEGEEPTISYKIGYRYNDEQTECTVFITDVKVGDIGDGGFKKSNYDITINDKDANLYRLPGEEKEGDGEYIKPFPGDGESDENGVEIGTIPVISTPSTGGGTKKKYQLYLANKDYLETGETPVYYEKEGLELFSRHNKKYTYAGGSFTIWYEKDGVPNDGNYRIFWSKSANGEYKEVKFDDVSEYYQIRNVYSNVFVKIFYENGFPVANEEISATDARAYAQANKIVVITPEPTNVQIISMAGAVVATDQVTGQREFANLTEGVYIVRMGETTVKLQVRD